MLNRLHAGVRVELILEYDTRNICAEGLDFQKFIRLGGQFYAHRAPGLMHHKFAVVDDTWLLTGSFNWTYNSNAENMLMLPDPALCGAYQEEFKRQKDRGKRIFRIRYEDAKVFSTYALFENTLFDLPDLRKKITGGAGVWLVRLEKTGADRDVLFRENYLPFDHTGMLRNFWAVWRIWDKALFDEQIRILSANHTASALSDLRRWARRMHSGDVVFATEKDRLIAIGMVQSQPQPYPGEVFSSFRDVQWLKMVLGKPLFCVSGVSSGALSKFRGSALRILQEIFEADKTTT